MQPMPSCAARSFMRLTKPVMLPATCWASAMAASLPEGSKQAVEHRLQAHVPAERQHADLGAGGVDGGFGHEHARAGRFCFDGQQRGHHLGQAGDAQAGVGVVLPEHLAGVEVEEDAGAGWVVEGDVHDVLLRQAEPTQRQSGLAERQADGGERWLDDGLGTGGLGGGSRGSAAMIVTAAGFGEPDDERDGERGEQRERTEPDRSAAPAAPAREFAPPQAFLEGHEGRAHDAQRGGLRSAPTIPTASSTRIRMEIRLAMVKPCSIAAATVRKAKPAMKTSTAPSTRIRRIGLSTPVAAAVV